ncbi:hypothetical protein L596_024597 [Steinernema carpocapsae]|uniref:Uncharacterized protein n=1 Tax=Steinernema carpocapsae TaxID=34508 RepID=A0A4U5MH74_STECR|nr:hypothetical protein L596_024597 [Steinernema carpocapsae]
MRVALCQGVPRRPSTFQTRDDAPSKDYQGPAGFDHVRGSPEAPRPPHHCFSGPSLCSVSSISRPEGVLLILDAIFVVPVGLIISVSSRQVPVRGGDEEECPVRATEGAKLPSRVLEPHNASDLHEVTRSGRWKQLKTLEVYVEVSTATTPTASSLSKTDRSGASLKPAKAKSAFSRSEAR